MLLLLGPTRRRPDLGFLPWSSRTGARSAPPNHSPLGLRSPLVEPAPLDRPALTNCSTTRMVKAPHGSQWQMHRTNSVHSKKISDDTSMYHLGKSHLANASLDQNLARQLGPPSPPEPPHAGTGRATEGASRPGEAPIWTSALGHRCRRCASGRGAKRDATRDGGNSSQQPFAM